MTRHTGLLRLAILFVVVLALAGCSRFKWFQKDDPLETLPVDQLYDTGKTALENGNLSRARRYYQRLIARFPYGPYTEQAQLELAYAQYKGSNPEDATSTVNRFIRTYPTHPHIDYAYYLKALINFNRENAFLDRIARIDMTQRDQGAPRQAFNDFAELINRYPNSIYAPDARQRMVHLRNLMARHEINVATYYLRRGAWVAAANRGQYILEHYPQSMHDADALAVMTESYRRLGQDTLAADTRRVLELNHPEHPYLRGDWPEKRSLFKRLWPFDDEGDDADEDDAEQDAVAALPPSA
ncbi:outer membrane protein assembly factor BamD [Chiayiivirga flava]|uniref:Outer membrane protein assembly factor BamD n=1 Tax=Chiayiivirga flava TaxID=659595 RepID=A0A7W8G136_9GAMM|nr:outer membrane protein assembly factor BamD [Chiayiivirga flava]MBB5208989.1 outer membrane protein assembly factor BamD [Chiayiivirga flava]